MADPFVAEIRIFPFNFAPKGWAFCNGQLLPISQNTALFALLSTTYGGDGKSTFALPNLEGRVPLQAGQGPGLSEYDLGESTGSETVTLLTSEIPAHSHAAGASPDFADSRTPTVLARPTSPIYTSPAAQLTPIAPQGVTPSGGDQPHNNLMPFLVFNYCIALQGIFPPRS
jgi:microcystin-dependent protein